MPTLYNVIRRPLITEKGLGVKETEGTLVFDVAPEATKTEVKQAVESPDWKKAYVRLKAGQKLPEYVSNL